MGTNFIDQYSLLHFAMGIVAYFFYIPLWLLTIIHIVFEVAENSPTGIHFINTYFKRIWPGGKNYSDTFINSIGDIISSILGWLLAYGIDKLGQKMEWYNPHFNYIKPKG